MTEKELNEIKARCEAATPGPWIVADEKTVGDNWLIGYGADSITGKYIYITTDHLHASEHNGATAKDDAGFCAAARQDIPALIVEVRRMTQERNEAKLLLGKAAMEINVAGPVHERIRILRRELSEDIEKLTTENARMRAALENIVNPEYWSENWFDPGIVRLAVDALEGGAQSTCKWEHDLDRETDVWETSCGDAVVFDEGEPKEHGYKFCHYCGKSIEFVENEKGGEG